MYQPRAFLPHRLAREPADRLPRGARLRLQLRRHRRLVDPLDGACRERAAALSRRRLRRALGGRLRRRRCQPGSVRLGARSRRRRESERRSFRLGHRLVYAWPRRARRPDRHLAPAPLMEIIYYVAASLDGFIATPDGGIDWLKPFEGTGEHYGYGEFFAPIKPVLLGRVPYEQGLQFPEWLSAGKPYWVLSRAKENPPA